MGVTQLTTPRTLSIGGVDGAVHPGQQLTALYAPAATQLEPYVSYAPAKPGALNILQPNVIANDSTLSWTVPKNIALGSYDLDVGAYEQAAVGCSGAHTCIAQLQCETSLDITIAAP